tara:strand:+ start:512 stop:1093 length:582 start_codon:yes stop_codon:yes gene_type:complete
MSTMTAFMCVVSSYVLLNVRFAWARIFPGETSSGPGALGDGEDVQASSSLLGTTTTTTRHLLYREEGIATPKKLRRKSAPALLRHSGSVAFLEKAKAAEARTELVTKDPNASKEARKKEVPKRRNAITSKDKEAIEQVRKEHKEKTRRERRNAITSKDKDAIEQVRKEYEKKKKEEEEEEEEGNEAPEGCCGK